MSAQNATMKIIHIDVRLPQLFDSLAKTAKVVFSEIFNIFRNVINPAAYAL
jgi:hypothetical protein